MSERLFMRQGDEIVALRGEIYCHLLNVLYVKAHNKHVESVAITFILTITLYISYNYLTSYLDLNRSGRCIMND